MLLKILFKQTVKLHLLSIEFRLCTKCRACQPTSKSVNLHMQSHTVPLSSTYIHYQYLKYVHLKYNYQVQEVWYLLCKLCRQLSGKMCECSINDMRTVVILLWQVKQYKTIVVTLLGFKSCTTSTSVMSVL